MPARNTDTTAATAGHMQRAALRAVDDPATLARAARIVRAALARRALKLSDLQGDIIKSTDLPNVRRERNEEALAA